jgi:type II secretory pathway component PulF
MADSLMLQIRLRLARSQLRRQRSNFYYEIGASLREHVPLVSTLRKYETRARLRGSDAALVYLEILRGFQNGTLSAAMGRIASPLEQSLIDATQSAGDGAMADGLQFLAQTVEKVDRMRATLTKAIVYPVFLLLMFSSMLTVFSRLAVPVLVELMAPEKWPPLGQVLFYTSQLVTQRGLLLLGVLLLVLELFLFSLPRWTGPLRRKLDDYFPYNIYRDFSGSLLLVSLASMMNAGVSLRTSLTRTQSFATPWMRWHVRKILLNLSRSNSPHFGQAFQTGVLNTEMTDRVQDASERRNPVEAFIRTGSRAIDLMVVTLDKRATVINMSMLLICGLFLGVMFAGFMSTAMSMQGGLREAR